MRNSKPTERRRLDPALRHVETVAEERDSQLAHVAAVTFLHRVQIGEQLARMQQVAEPVDDGTLDSCAISTAV